jgi:hypothetical protein|tara:strand:- start:1244 stop:1447 length:204 start_codon:yes stop_codon:yes gene_type:complete
MYNCILRYNGDSVQFQLNNNDRATVTYTFGYDGYKEVKECVGHEAQEHWDRVRKLGYKVIFNPRDWN